MIQQDPYTKILRIELHFNPRMSFGEPNKDWYIYTDYDQMPLLVDSDWMEKYKPEVDGYIILERNGSISYSAERIETR